MDILKFISLVVYNIFIILCFRKLVVPRKEEIYIYLCPIIVNIAITVPAYLFLDSRIIVYPLILAMVIITSILFKINLTQLFFISAFFMFSLYCSQGLLLTLISIILNKSIYGLLKIDGIIFSLSVIYSILSILFYRKIILSEKKSKQLFNNKAQLKFLTTYLFIQLLYLTLINDGIYRQINQIWFSYLFLFSCVFSKIWLLVIVKHSVKMSEVLSYESDNYFLKKQLVRQIQHYQSYRKFEERFRVFHHDFDKIINVTKRMIKNDDNNITEHLLNSIQELMEKEVLTHKCYSNNFILDAIFHETMNICEEKDISFTAYVEFENSKMTDIEIVRVFSNVIENAIEACDRVIDYPKFIEIISKNNDNWYIVEAKNSFNGVIKLKKGKLITIKNNKDYHGLGFKIIKETINNIGRLTNIDYNVSKNVFTIKLCIPKNNIF